MTTFYTTGQLIEFLKKFPPDTPVKKSCSEDCEDGEGFDIYRYVYPEFKEFGDYPNDETNLVVL